MKRRATIHKPPHEEIYYPPVTSSYIQEDEREDEEDNDKEGGEDEEGEGGTKDDINIEVDNTQKESKKTSYPQTKLYLLNTLPDKELRLYLFWKITEIVLSSQVFLCMQVILYIYMSLNSRSMFYWAFYAPIPIVHFLSSIAVLFQRSIWSIQDVRSLLTGNFSDFCSGLTSIRTNYRPFTTWISYCLLLLVYSVVLLVVKPVNLYKDKFDPPTNTSSCTRESRIDTGNVYHPDGYFSIALNYSSGIQLKMCAMDQTYAYPNLYQYIIGYSSSPITSTEACSSPLPPFTSGALVNKINGYADTSICVNPATGKSKSYISPVLGVLPPVLPNSFRASEVLCRGNTDSNVCISANGDVAYNSGDCPTLHRIGKPLKICPICLNYIRSMSGDLNGPPGYEHCAVYDASAYSNPFCWLCPGRGYGPFPDEIYTNEQLTENLVISSIISGLLFIEIGIRITLIARYIPNIRNNTTKEINIINSHSNNKPVE